MAIDNQALMAGILASNNKLQRPIDPYGASTVNPYTPQASGFTPQAPTPAVDPRYANALRTYGAEEEAIKAQRLKAAALAKDANEAPGLITAGKVSAPGANWMTALSQAGNAWAGMKEGEKARALSKTLAKDQAKSAKDAGELAAEAVTREEATTAAELKHKADTLAEQNRAALARERYQAGTLAQTIAKDKRAAGERELQFFHNPDYDPDVEGSSPTLAYTVGKNGGLLDYEGNPVDPTRLREVDDGTVGSGANVVPIDERVNAGMAKFEPGGKSSVDNLVSILTDDNLPTGTGTQWDRYVGQALPDIADNIVGGNKYRMIQDLQRRVQENMLMGLIPTLAEAELKPISNTDLDELKAEQAGVDTSPLGIVGHAVDNYRARFVRQFNETLAEAKTDEEREAIRARALPIQRRMEGGIIEGALRTGYPIELLVSKGFPAHIIEMKRKQLEAQGGLPK